MSVLLKSAVLGCCGVCISLACLGSCGGSSSNTPPTATPSHSASAKPLDINASRGATPIQVTWTERHCELTLSDSVGSTYRFDPGQMPKVQESLKATVSKCFNTDKGGHGMAYIEAHLGAEGNVSEVVVSPGGAISTAVSGCLTSSLEGTVLAPALEKDAEALLFLVSNCTTSER